jgi:alpha,alpha-trehalase
MSIAVHYRNVANKDMASFREALAKASRPHIASLLIKPSIGKKVIELGLVTAWNKGKAVNWLIQRLKRSKIIQSYVPIYIGDDVTDETAFTTLKHKGITIHVGRGKRSAASYYLRNPPEVAIFLRKLTELL